MFMPYIYLTPLILKTNALDTHVQIPPAPKTQHGQNNRYVEDKQPAHLSQKTVN